MTFNYSYNKQLENVAEIKDFFDEWDFYEEFNPLTVYSQEEFYEDFGKGKRQYKYSLYDIRIKETFQIKQFVVAIEIYTVKELKTLEKHCPCDNCSIYNTFMYIFYFSWLSFIAEFIAQCFACDCCVGCIKSGPESARKYQVDEARIKLLNEENSKKEN